MGRNDADDADRMHPIPIFALHCNECNTELAYTFEHDPHLSIGQTVYCERCANSIRQVANAIECENFPPPYCEVDNARNASASFEEQQQWRLRIKRWCTARNKLNANRKKS